MTWALEDQVRDNWLEIMSKQDDWDNNNEKAQYVCLLKQLGMTTLGPKAYKQQCKVMENGSIKIPESNFRKGTERFF